MNLLGLPASDLPGLVLSVLRGLGVPQSLAGRPTSSPLVAGCEATEEGGRSGESAPRFSGDLEQGDMGEEGDSWMVGGRGMEGRDCRHRLSISFPPRSIGPRGEVGRGPGKRPDRIGKPGCPRNGWFGWWKGLPPLVRWGLVWRALARSSRNISSWEPAPGPPAWWKGPSPPPSPPSHFIALGIQRGINPRPSS